MSLPIGNTSQQSGLATLAKSSYPQPLTNHIEELHQNDETFEASWLLGDAIWRTANVHGGIDECH
eukprot:5782-Amphidinium_carterae.1